MNIEQSKLRALAERYTAAWCSQDPERVAECYSPGGSLRVNTAAPAMGRDAVRAVARGFMNAFPDMVVRMDEVRVEGERAVYAWTLTGSNTGPGGTGRRVRISGQEVWTMAEDGLIGRSEGSFDEAEYRRQLEGETP